MKEGLKNQFKSVWFHAVLSLAISFGLLVIIDPGQQIKHRISNTNISWDVENVNPGNARSEFSLFDTSYFVIHPGAQKPVIVNYNFHFDGRIRVVLGITGWATIEKEGDGIVDYVVLKNSDTIYNEKITHIEDQEFYFDVLQQDSITVIIDKGENISGDLGCITFEKSKKKNLFWIIPLCCLVGIWFFFLLRQGYFFIFLFPGTVSYLLLSVCLSKLNLFEFEDFLVSVVLFGLFTGAQTLIYQSKSKIFRLLTSSFLHIMWIILAILPLSFISYESVYGEEISRDQYMAFFQTNTAEAIEYMETGTPVNIVIVFVVLIVLSIVSVLKSRVQKRIPQKHLILISILVFIQLILLVQNWNQLNFLQSAVGYYKEYKTELVEYKKSVERFKNMDTKVEATKNQKGETYVVVIGESLNKNHMSLYGYHRKTTPFLDSLNETGELSVFENAIANHTHTMSVLGLSFTQANQLNGYKPSEAAPLIPMLKSAGFKTFWLSNQMRYGIYDNLVSVIAQSCDETYFINKNIGEMVVTNDFDGAIISRLSSILSKSTDENRVIFVHLMGSHGAYDERYPEEFEAFKGDLNRSVFGNQHPRYINYYDNSVLYNDWVISKVFDELKSVSGQPASMVYFSDHSEDVKRGLGHNSGAFTFEMVEIPFLVWFNDSYVSRYPEKVKTVKKNLPRYFSNDLFYEMALGLMEVKTKANYLPLDITDTSFNLTEKDVYTYHGKKKIIDPEYRRYHIQRHQSALLQQNQGLKYIPHRVNTKGMLFEVIEHGFKGMELDLVTEETENENAVFKIGHFEEKFMTNNTLEDVLQWDTKQQLQKIWLDVKNLDDANMGMFLSRLNQLDKKYNLKNRIIVESSTPSPEFKKISDGGFHTSYYLPYSLFDLSDPKSKRNRAQQIINQIKSQKVAAISFDNGLYGFVVEYLEPGLNKEIIYHTWDTSKEFNDPDLLQQLQTADYWENERVKTVLLRFKSPYYL
ncbi:MAG: hypothetical protein CL840_12545 [Crocinitomicaceae bacterium]|nr:hypothetical protein [Crocinitomicaceae bacterium]